MQNIISGEQIKSMVPLRDISGDPLVSDALSTNWLFILLLIPLVLFTFISAIYRNQILNTLRVIGSYSSSSTAFRASHSGTRPDQSFLAVVALLSIPTFAYFIELSWGKSIVGLSGFRLWLLNFGIVAGAMMLRFLLTFLTGIISGTSEVFREYIFNISQSYKFFGILLVIINFCIPYLEIVPDKWLIFIGLSILIVLYFLRLIRLIQLFIRRSFSLSYMILYLCALEFAPVLIFIKYLSGQIS